MPRALIIEDDASLARILTLGLTDRGYAVEHAADGATGAARLLAEAFDLVLLDLNLPGLPGLEVLGRLPAGPDRPAVVVMTANGAIESAVEAMRRGADDYLVKGPEFHRELPARVDHALVRRALARENRELRRRLDAAAPDGGLVGSAPAWTKAIALLGQAADSDATVLITGESGTGKELAARRLHALSRRAAGPFVTVNCAAIPEALVESELFGHVKGAFTGATQDHPGRFERASGGTLFFDEIGDLPAPAQAKLLRAIQEREIERVGSTVPVPVDIRLVAATHRDLRALTAAGRFREDLWFRLNVLTVPLPALRDRADDLPGLVAHFLRLHHRPDVALAPAALAALRHHRWPGNVREFGHVIERALVLLGKGTLLTPDLLPDDVRSGGAPAGATGAAGEAPAGDFVLPAGGVDLEDVERDLIAQALRRTGGNQTKAAELLGISRATLLYRMEKFKLKS